MLYHGLKPNEIEVNGEKKGMPTVPDEKKKDTYLTVNVTEEQKEWLEETGDELGLGMAGLTRLILYRVREIGDGDPIIGIGRLQVAHEQITRDSQLRFQQQDAEEMLDTEESNETPTGGVGQDNGEAEVGHESVEKDEKEVSGLDAFRTH